MRKILIAALLSVFILNTYAQTFNNNSRRKLVKFSKSYEKKLDKFYNRSKSENLVAPETPLQYLKELNVMTMDLELKRSTPEVLHGIIEEINRNNSKVANRAMPGTTTFPWANSGPFNAAGRIKAIAYDPKDNKKVWVGTSSGGLWYNSDIYVNNGGNWTFVSEKFCSNIVSSIAFDSSGTMYVGTGDFALISNLGCGIYKSTDGGKNFSKVANSDKFMAISSMAVRKENNTNVLYVSAGTPNYDFEESNSAYNLTGKYFGVYKSSDGGNTWVKVPIFIDNQNNQGDVIINDMEIDGDNNLWLGSNSTLDPVGTNLGGGRVYKLDPNGNLSLKYLYQQAGPEFNSRVELAVSRNKNKKMIYAAFTHNDSVVSIIRTSNDFTTQQRCGLPNSLEPRCSKDISGGQGWYDLILQISPLDVNKILIGAVDLYGSVDSGTTWSTKAVWTTQYYSPTATPPNTLHADYHSLVFLPASDNLLIGNDGGIAACFNIWSGKPTYINKSLNLPTLDIYHGSAQRDSASTKIIFGAQDNGTFENINGTMTQVYGGDGGYSFFSNSGNTRFLSTQKGNYYIKLSNGTIAKIITGQSANNYKTRYFINPAEYWEKSSTSYALIFSANPTEIGVFKLPTGPENIVTFSNSWTDRATAFAKGNLGSTGKDFLYVGTNTGKIFYNSDVENLLNSNSNPTFTELGSGSINPGHITSISTLKPNSKDTLAVTLANYGTNMKNVYISVNGGVTFQSVEGDLPNVPVYTLIFNPNRKGEALIGTEIGVFGTKDIYAAGGNVIWTLQSKNMGYIRVTKLQFRESDKFVFAFTYGRGVFVSNAWTQPTPKAMAVASSYNVCVGEKLVLTDKSEYSPIKYFWSISPKIGFSYSAGFNSTSKNNEIVFSRAGVYKIQHSVLNAKGEGDTFVFVQDFVVGDTVFNNFSIVSKDQNPTTVPVVCEGDIMNVAAVSGLAMDSSKVNIQWFVNNSSIYKGIYVKNQSYKATNDSSFQFYYVATSNEACRVGKIAKSDTLVYKKIGSRNVNVDLVLDTLVADFGDSMFANIGQESEYYWYKSGRLSELGQKIKPRTNGEYKCVAIQYYSTKTCISDTSSAIVLTTLQIQNLIANAIKVFPNPATDKLNIRSELSGKLQLKTLDGKLVSEQNINANETILSLKSLAKGMYLVEFMADEYLDLPVLVEKISVQ